ncbi:hypothetical protein GQX74_009445 [Glossina fuscipes]|nr:hypothetical protein GQX74_009445 [Glossina fuscipes]
MEELSLNYLLYTGPKFCFLLSLVDIKHSDYVTTNVYCRLHIIRLGCLQKEKKGFDKLRTYQLPNNSKNGKFDISLSIFMKNSGKLSQNQTITNAATCAISNTGSESKNSELLTEVIKRLWKIDDGGSYDNGLSQNGQQCDAHFISTQNS